MMEITKRFGFDSAHTLIRKIDSDSSRRVHGHSYIAEIALVGSIDPASGMVIDLGDLERKLAYVRYGLDHRMLDDVEGLGPATLENLAVWIWGCLKGEVPSLSRVTVLRESAGESATYRGASACI